MMNRRTFVQAVSGGIFGILQLKPVAGSIRQDVAPNHKYIKDVIGPVPDHRYDQDGIIIEGDSPGVELNKAQLIVVAGRPAMGKSILVQNIAQHMSQSRKISVGYFSEIKTPQLLNRMIIAQRIAGESETENNRHEVPEFNIVVDDSGQISMQELDKSITAMVHGHGINLIVIDSVDNIYIKAADPDEKVEEIVQYLKTLSQKYHIPVIVTFGLNDEVYNREDKRPRLTDLVNYRAVDRYADSITYLYRDEVYADDSEYKGTVSVHSVNAYGIADRKLMKFDGKNYRIRICCLSELFRMV